MVQYDQRGETVQYDLRVVVKCMALLASSPRILDVHQAAY